MAQLAYNDKLSQTIGLTPFFVNYGKNLNSFLQLREGLNAEKALVKAKELKKVYNQLTKTIKETNKKVRQ